MNNFKIEYSPLSIIEYSPHSRFSTYKRLVKALLILGKLPPQIGTKINHTMKNRLSYCNIWFVFQTKCKISNCSTFDDRIPLFLCYDIVYKFQCDSCNTTYYCKTKRHFKISIFLHSLEKS